MRSQPADPREAEVVEAGAGGSGAESATAPAAPVGSSALRVLTSRQFGPFFLGSVVSNIGTWFQNIAAGLLVFALTGSSLLVGILNFALFVGALVLAPWAGSAADRYDRRRLLIWTQVASAAITGALALLTFTGAVTAPLVIGLNLLLGLALAFMVPALLALVPLLVRREDLDAAVSLNSITFNLARAIGPLLGALVAERYGYAPAFAVNTASFVAFVVALTLIRPRAQALATGPRPKLSESVRIVRHNQVWTALLIVVTAVSATTDPVNTLTPEFGQDVFGGTDVTTGYLVASFGAGATLTAVTLTGWLRRRPNALVGAMLVEGLGVVVFGLGPTLWVSMLGMAVCGGGFIAAITRATSRIQSEVPDDLLGRVMALWSLAFVGSRPLASLLDGVVAGLAGPRAAAVVMSLPVFLTAAWTHRLVRRRRAAAATAASPTPARH